MIQELIGRFHPLFVHLPIGFLVLAIILKTISIKWKNEAINTVMPMILLLSFILSIFTCISGYLLFQSGGYEKELAEKHQWAGIILTLFTGLLYFLRGYTLAQQLGWILVTFLLVITGHLGGSITHGEDYLSLKEKTITVKRKEISNIQEEKVFDSVILPILEEKCFSCHSSKKQKGELRLDSKQFILKGGEHPNGIIPYQPLNSLLYKRLILDETEKEHMPPKGKPQPTEAEIKLISWWISEGVSFDKKVKELKQSTEILPLLLALQSSGSKNAISNIPSEEIDQASQNDIQNLKNIGAVVTPIGLNSNYLSVNISGNKKINAQNLSLLLPIKKQLIWLKAGNLDQISNLGEVLSKLTNLTVLHLNQSAISDNDLNQLVNLKNLQILNVTNTNVTEKGISALTSLPNLAKIFLFQTKVDKRKWSNLSLRFPNTFLDSGGYLVPTLETDTARIEYTKK